MLCPKQAAFMDTQVSCGGRVKTLHHVKKYTSQPDISAVNNLLDPTSGAQNMKVMQ